MGYAFGWILLSFIMIFLARSKGRSGLAWFFISILISPLIAVIILLVIGDSDDKKFEDLQTQKKMSEKIDNKQKNKTDQAIEELNRYKNLLELGAITQKEFDEKKSELMPILRKDIDKDETKSATESIASSIEEPIKEDRPIPAKIEKPTKKGKEPFLQRYGLLMFYAVIILLIGGFALTHTLITRHKEKVQLEQSLKPAPLAMNAPLSKPNFDLSTLEEEKVVFSATDKKIIDQFFALYDELMGFKNKADFIRIGFTPSGKYYKWLQKVHKLNTDANTQILIKLRAVPYDLEGLGLEYVSSNGKETEASKLFQSSIKEARSQYKELTKK